jgi:hypothetical protein
MVARCRVTGRVLETLESRMANGPFSAHNGFMNGQEDIFFIIDMLNYDLL